MHKSFAASMVIALGVMTASSAARAELVINGGFETGAAWLLIGGGPFPNFGYTAAQAHTGSRSFEFANALARDDTIRQTLATTAGTSYTLSFWLFNSQQGNDHLRVSWEGGLVIDLLPVNIPLNTWTQFTYTVTASLTGSELRFAGYDVPDRIRLDDVSVVAVPTPATLSLGALTLCTFARRRRR
ncbi:MAG: hypothetical protein IBJ18_09785 [Phycisphaerales bacterium]|nr:hypothetical protein [Phycisphaerales bacterium]